MKYRPPSDVLVKVENQPETEDTLRLIFQDGHIKELTVYGYNVEEKNDNRRVVEMLLAQVIKLNAKVEFPPFFERDKPESPDAQGGTMPEVPLVPEDGGGQAMQTLPSEVSGEVRNFESTLLQRLNDVE